MENNSFVVIGHRNGYKTYSYLPAICSLYDGIDDTKDKDGIGPKAIIIVKSSKDVETISSQIRKDFTNNTLKVVMAYGVQKLENVMVSSNESLKFNETS